MPAGVERVRVVGQLDPVVEQHGARPGGRRRSERTVPARAEPIRATAADARRAARVVCGPTPSSRAASRSAAVSTSRRTDGDVVPGQVDEPARAGVARTPSPGPNSGGTSAGRRGPAAASSRCPPRRGRTPHRAPAAPAQRHRELGRPQRRQVGRERARPTCPGARRAATSAPWTSAGLRPAVRLVGDRPGTGRGQRSARLRVVGDDQHGARRRRRRARPSSCPARRPGRGHAGASSYGVAEPGLGHGQPLDGHHEAPAPASVVRHAPILPVALDTGSSGRDDWTADRSTKGLAVTDGRVAVRRRRRGKLGFWYRLAAIILRRPLMVLTRRDWRGAEHIPDGGAVVVVNHVSHFDPLSFAHFLYDNGRLPRFLAKDGAVPGLLRRVGAARGQADPGLPRVRPTRPRRSRRPSRRYVAASASPSTRRRR